MDHRGREGSATREGVRCCSGRIERKKRSSLWVWHCSSERVGTKIFLKWRGEEEQGNSAV